MPRALWAFRWGAAWTWITGLVLLGLVYYNTGLVFKDPTVKTWGTGGIAVLVALLFFAVYDPLAKAIAKTEVHFWLGLVVATAAVLFFSHVGGFGFRGTAIHLGGDVRDDHGGERLDADLAGAEEDHHGHEERREAGPGASPRWRACAASTTRTCPCR